GGNKKVPFSTDDRVDNPVSLYAATKKSNELMAHCYSKLYNIPSTGLRFFTVYGPAGRPDMAYFGFTNKLLRGQTIQIYNYGNCRRDFTYVDDIVEGIVRVMKKAPEKRTGPDGLPIPPYAVYNIGNNQPENLLTFVDILQQELIRAKVLPEDYDFEAHRELVPMQPGDVPVTYADSAALERDFGFTPRISIREGKTIQIFNYGNCKRDFTYVDDIVEGVFRVMQGAPERETGEDGLPKPPYRVYNIGGGTPENLLDYISTLQQELVRAGVLPEDYDFEAHRELVPMQPGDVPVTYADSAALERDFGFTPRISIREGLRKFAQWYKAYYKA
ncbi:MAG: NAD-dependent epimerase/dehydratase family protein, partial [Oscillospiraceae bacterium]|nr:NAD-dependent epimerase/dehydratase family protein [Oscillospiraceae bacterium]